MIIFKKYFAVLFTFIWILCAGAGALGQSNTTQILLQKAHALEQRGRIDLAAKVWQQVLLADPKDAEALSGLARYAKQSGNPDAAGQYLDQLQKVDPAAHLQTAEIRQPVDTQQKAKLDQAAQLAAQHKPDAAMRLYKEVFGAHPPDGDWSIAYYGTLAATSNGSAESIARLRELAKRYPDDSRYALTLARLLTYNPRTRAEGVKDLESIPATDASASAVRDSWRQALLWERGNPAYGASLREYLSRYPDPNLEKEFGPIGTPKSATELADERDEQAAYQALRDDKTEQAEQLFEKMRSNPSGTTAGLIGLGFVRMKEQNFAGAVEVFEEAKSRSTEPNRTLEQALGTAQFWHQMQEATQNLDQNHLDSALSSFQQALALRPNNPDALGGEAGTLLKQGQTASAVPVFRKWTQVSPNEQKAWLGLLRALQKSGDAAGTIAAAKEMPATVRATSLDDPEFLLALSEAYRVTGNTNESQRLLQQALQNSSGAKGSADTQMQIASSLADSGNFTQATEIYVGLLKQDPQKLNVWEGLIGTLHQANKDPEALAVSAKMPADVYGKALERSDFLVTMAGVYEAQEQLEPAHRMLEKALQQEMAGGQSAPLPLQLQIAGLWLKEKQYDKAIDLIGQLIGHYPENLEAWRGELAAFHESHQDSKAIATVEQASEAVQHQLDSDPDVLSLLAFAHSAQGDHDLAVRLVRQAAWQYQATRRPVPADLEIQSGWIFLDAGEGGSLYSDLKSLSARSDLSVPQRKTLGELWAAWSLKKADADAATGNFNQSLTILSSARRAFPDNLKVRSAFASTLVRAGYARQGFDEYRTWGLLGGQPDDYAGAVGASIGAREFKIGEAWLDAALKQWPNDPKLLMMGAKLAVARGDYSRANHFYQEALAQTPADTNSLTPFSATANPSASDQSAAMRNLASLLVPDDAQKGTSGGGVPRSDHPDALDAFLADLSSSPATSRNASSGVGNMNPGNDRSLSISPSQQMQNGSSYLAPVSSSDPNATAASQNSASATNDSLKWLFDDSGGKSSNANRSDGKQKSKQQTAPWYPDASSNVPAAVPAASPVGGSHFVDPSSPTQWGSNQTVSNSGSQQVAWNVSSNGPPAFVDASATISSTNSAPGTAITASPRDEVENEIAGMSSQLSPYVGTEAVLHGRSGQPGFDKLISQQANFEASTTLGESVRLTLIAEPVVLDAGTPTGQSTLQMGTLAAGTTFGPMGAAGLGAEAQLATQNFGASLGVTPEGFLVHNFIGSLQFRPEGGPIQITATRAPVTDTLLSYAGIRDPGSGQVWGGVISNGISGLGSWGSAASGFYGGLGYQYITGEGVETNTSFNGSVGSYWRVLSRPNGSLTIGLNFSGMHYAQNLRYFTLGQGGYFSPQSYLLFNVPVHYGGSYENRFEYSVDASLGSQHFQEDASPYFPLSLTSTVAAEITFRPRSTTTPTSITNSYYPAQISTGANYNMLLKGGYRLTENWVLGGFLNVNNTANYASQTAGFYVQYQFRPAPVNTNSLGANLPDWNSIRPLALK